MRLVMPLSGNPERAATVDLHPAHPHPQGLAIHAELPATDSIAFHCDAYSWL
jgi:hypothetical protein